MRFARKLMLLAITAVAAVALSASAASAQEISDESTGTHCDPTCTISATGNSQLLNHNMGIESQISACSDTFSGTINEAGEGSITTISLSGGSCISIPCSTSGTQDPWPFHIDTIASGHHLNITFCLFGAGGTKNNCTIEADITDNGHSYTITASDDKCTGSGQSATTEVNGTWTATGGFEIS